VLVPIVVVVVVNILMGPERYKALGGVLMGSIVTGLFVAISMTPVAVPGHARSTSRKSFWWQGFGHAQGAVTGDTVGDPYKDTAGPAITAHQDHHIVALFDRATLIKNSLSLPLSRFAERARGGANILFRAGIAGPFLVLGNSAFAVESGFRSRKIHRMNSARLALVSFKTCPFVQRHAIVLLEKGRAVRITYIDQTKKPDWFLKSRHSAGRSQVNDTSCSNRR